jgi:inorganic triphosphatase YgiF
MNRPPETSREVELKLELRERDHAALARHPWLREISEGRAKTRTLANVYYDTEELSLWKKGLVLRVRSVGRHRILGVKTRGLERGGLVSRDECEVALPAGAGPASLVAAIPDRRLRRAVGRAAGGRPLVPRVETRFRRSTRRLRYGKAKIELALDVGEVRAGRGRIPIREVELELLRGRPRALYDVALRLAEDVTLRPATLGKAERGFRHLLGDEARSSKSIRPDYPRSASLETVLRAVLGEGLRQIAANQTAIEGGTGPEGVHQMRVGVRRLRSALRLFRGQLPARETRELAHELRWLQRSLGEARDLDVFLGELIEPLARRRPRDRGLAALREAAEARRRKAHATARRTLASDRYATLLLRLGRFVEGDGFRRRAAADLERPARPLAEKLLRKRAASMHRLGDRLDELSIAELHKLRIRAKRLRYATEQLAPLIDARAAKEASRRLSALQDALGHLNDRAVAEALVKRVRSQDGDPKLARAEGFVSEFAARSAARGRKRLERTWRRVAKLGPYWR